RTLHLMRQKSQPAIAAARFLAARVPPVRAVALEQAWAYGDRPYLGNGVRIVDIPPKTPLDAERVRAAAEGCDAVGLYARDAPPELRRAIEREGFRGAGGFRSGPAAAVEVFLREEVPGTSPAQSGQ